MNEYLAGMIARSEHELMKRSLPPVYEFDERGQVHQPGRATRHIGRLLQSLRSILVSPQERRNCEQGISCEATVGIK
jgi:hypothetical protein